MKDCARQAFDEAAAAITGKRDLKIPAGSFPAYFLRIKYSSPGMEKTTPVTGAPGSAGLGGGGGAPISPPESLERRLCKSAMCSTIWKDSQKNINV